MRNTPVVLPQLPQGFYHGPILLIQLSLILILKSNLFWLLVVIHLPQQDDGVCGMTQLKMSPGLLHVLHFGVFWLLKNIYAVQ